MAVIYVSNQWPRGNGIVADAPTFSMADSSIATYSNGKILGLSEGTTTLTASLYGLTATIVPTINVHDCNKHWDQGKITKQPTNKHEGEKTFTCSVCGKTKTRSIKAAGHSYGEYVVVKEPTSTEKGLKSKTCSVCGKVYSVTLAKTDSSNANIRNTTNSEQNTQTNQYTTKKIKLNRRKLTLKRGKSFKLKVTLTPINSRDKITYVTSNKKVVKVYRNGRIKALKKGKANITVISGNKKVICRVTVMKYKFYKNCIHKGFFAIIIKYIYYA